MIEFTEFEIVRMGVCLYWRLVTKKYEYRIEPTFGEFYYAAVYSMPRGNLVTADKESCEDIGAALKTLQFMHAQLEGDRSNGSL